MHTSISTRIHRILLGILLAGIVLISNPTASNLPISRGEIVQAPQSSTHQIPVMLPGNPPTSLTDVIKALIHPNEIHSDQPPVIDLIGFPPRVGVQPVVLPKSHSTKAWVPDSNYLDGCSPTGEGLRVAILDRGDFDLCNSQGISEVASEFETGVCPLPIGIGVGVKPKMAYSNLFTSSISGEIIPLVVDSSWPWPTWTDSVGDTYINNPLVASHQGIDGKTTRGTIDDYWVGYESNAPDPYITNGWAQHTWDAIGDYMYTSQSEFDNVDGSTRFYNNPAHPASIYTCEMMSSNSEADGTQGIGQFYQSKGYAVGACYNQQTDNVIAGGFSFAQFKAEIDAGWPVLIGINGHSVVGVGYDATTHMIYIFNGWDNDIHSMQWPDNCYDGHCSVSYKYPDTPPYTFDMALQSVSIVHIVPGTPKRYTITGNAGVPNATIAYTGGSTTSDSNGNYSFTVSENWFGTVKPSRTGYTFTPAERKYANVKANVVAQNYNRVNLIQDPGFELGSPNPYWMESTTPPYQLLCDASCGTEAHTGSSWAWFGGITANETGSLSQEVTIPTGSASLDFYLWIPYAPTGSDANDIFTVKVDGTTIFTANPTQVEYYYSAYRPININISAYADGKQHNVEFSATTTVQPVSFHLDDVSINSTPNTTPPPVFPKSGPSNGATNLPINPTLTWEKSENLTSYQYCYDKTNDNACSNWIDNGTATSVTLSGLEYDTAYYWHVRAVNNYGETYSNSSNTAFWQFTTIPELVIPTPWPEPTLPVITSQILTAVSLTNEMGTKSGTLASLNVQDQAGTANNPASYVSFQTPEGSYSGYLSFTLPQGAEARTISSMLLQINFKRPATNQIWTWSVYDPSSGMWINLGNSVGTTAGQWQSLVLRIPQPWRFISSANEIRIQLRSNNNNGDLQIDYEALHITYLSDPIMPIAPPVNTRRPGGF